MQRWYISTRPAQLWISSTDKPEKLKDLLFKHCPELEAQFDPIFLEVLECAFKIRYYDQLKEPIFIGIYLNQFIGALDYTIDTLEKYIAQTQLGSEWITPYKRAIQSVVKNIFTIIIFF